jgi:excisionase family DNA binding protein
MNALPPLAYRPKDASAHLGVSRTTLWRWVSAGRLGVTRIGGVTLISGDDVRRLAPTATPATPTPTPTPDAGSPETGRNLRQRARRVCDDGQSVNGTG